MIDLQRGATGLDDVGVDLQIHKRFLPKNTPSADTNFAFYRFVCLGTLTLSTSTSTSTAI